MQYDSPGGGDSGKERGGGTAAIRAAGPTGRVSVELDKGRSTRIIISVVLYSI